MRKYKIVSIILNLFWFKVKDTFIEISFPFQLFSLFSVYKQIILRRWKIKEMYQRVGSDRFEMWKYLSESSVLWSLIVDVCVRVFLVGCGYLSMLECLLDLVFFYYVCGKILDCLYGVFVTDLDNTIWIIVVIQLNLDFWNNQLCTY